MNQPTPDPTLRERLHTVVVDYGAEVYACAKGETIHDLSTLTEQATDEIAALALVPVAPRGEALNTALTLLGEKIGEAGALYTATLDALNGYVPAAPSAPETREPERPECGMCGGEISRNPHPDAGKPELVATVGAVWECIPCGVKARHGWYERATKAEGELRALDAGEPERAAKADPKAHSKTRDEDSRALESVEPSAPRPSLYHRTSAEYTIRPASHPSPLAEPKDIVWAFKVLAHNFPKSRLGEINIGAAALYLDEAAALLRDAPEGEPSGWVHPTNPLMPVAHVPGANTGVHRASVRFNFAPTVPLSPDRSTQSTSGDGIIFNDSLDEPVASLVERAKRTAGSIAHAYPQHMPTADLLCELSDALTRAAERERETLALLTELRDDAATAPHQREYIERVIGASPVESEER